jgi:hypothetical protein
MCVDNVLVSPAQYCDAKYSIKRETVNFKKGHWPLLKQFILFIKASKSRLLKRCFMLQGKYTTKAS